MLLWDGSNSKTLKTFQVVFHNAAITKILPMYQHHVGDFSS